MFGLTRERLRMLQWVFISACFYTTAIVLKKYGGDPETQIVAMKLGHITIAAFVGYWIDRSAFRRRTSTTNSTDDLRRAIIIAAAMLAIALGL